MFKRLSNSFLILLTLTVFIFSGERLYAAEEANANISDIIKSLEMQFQRQAEQNQKILELLRSMAENQNAPAPAAASENKVVTPKATPATAAPAASASESQQKIKYTPGWRARIYTMQEGFDPKGGLPNTEIGSFTAKKSSYKIADYAEGIGMHIENQSILWRGEGFLEAKTAGNYIVSLNVPDPGGGWDTYGEIYIEETSIANGTNGTIVGAAELEPGLYRVDFRAVNAVSSSSGKAMGDFRNDYATFEIKIKRPEDAQPRPAAEVLLVQVGK